MKFRKKQSRGTALRNIWTEISADWNIITHRNDDTYSVTHQKKTKKIEQLKIIHILP